jgi:voltage-gated potassium channel
VGTSTNAAKKCLVTRWAILRAFLEARGPLSAKSHSMQNDRILPRILEIALVFFTVAVFAALAVDTVIRIPPEAGQIVHWLDTSACIVFFADFCVRFNRADSKPAFMKWGWIDLIACIPNMPNLRYARLVRLLQVVRLLRGVRVVQRVLQLSLRHKIQTGAASLILTAILVIVFSSISILICEQNAEGNIKTAEDAIWWSVSTVSTVGYGDKVPVTTEGRIIGMMLMVAGVGMFGGLSGIVASLFLSDVGRIASGDAAIIARLNAIERKLDRLAGATEPPVPSPKTGIGETPS